MAVVDVAPTLTDVINKTSSGTFASFGGLLIILKAAGIAFIIYVIYAIIMAVVNIKRMRILGRIDAKMEILEAKIDSLVEIKNNRKKVKQKK